eukprot:4108726-Lingulodinium_polyedra.AAC.1
MPPTTPLSAWRAAWPAPCASATRTPGVSPAPAGPAPAATWRSSGDPGARGSPARPGAPSAAPS